MHSLKATVFFITAAAAAAVAPSRDYEIRNAPATTTSSNAPDVVTTPEPTAKPTSKCDYAYCDNNTSWCFYFAGITGWDPSRGPIPGETRTSLGPCGVNTAEV